MKTVHLIQHTHWDREWYFTENDSRALLYYFMADLIQHLEADESLGPFMLDGQTVVLEDYFQLAPENRERVQALVKAGRLLIGPGIHRPIFWWLALSPSPAICCWGRLTVTR